MTSGLSLVGIGYELCPFLLRSSARLCDGRIVAGMPQDKARLEAGWIAVAYRWATLVVGLLIALLAESQLGPERVVLLAPVLAAGLVSVLVARAAAAPWLFIGLVVESVVAAIVIWVTGHYDSPLILYLSAPAVHAALVRRERLVVALQALAVILFVGIVAVDPDVFAFQPGATIRDVALLVLLPLVVLGSQLTIGHGPRMRPSLELDHEDRAIASRLADGRTYKEIGQELDMSPETVKVAVARVYRRIGARNRDEAVRLIADLQLIRSGQDDR